MGDTASSAESVALSATEAVGEAASAVKTCAELWGLAEKRLGEADRAVIEGNRLKLSDLAMVLQEAKNKQDMWEARKRTFTFRGKEVKAREIWGKIVHSISTFKNFFGKLVALDTSGHAALPWAVISLVIGCLEYESTQLETVGDALTTVVEIIAYYVEFEKLYDNDHWQVVKKLKSAVVSVYANILKVLCLVRGYYEDKENRGCYTFFFSSPDTFKSKLSSIATGNMEVENYARLVRWETEKNMSNQVQDIQSSLKSLVFWADIETLSPVSSLEDHVEYSRSRVRDTGLWLLDRYEFQEWRYGPDPSLMLLTGSVGTGKSTLISLIIDGFLHDLTLVDKQPVLYFYGRHGQGPEDVLRNLVRQLLLAQSDTKAVIGLKLKGGPKLSPKDCLELIRAFIRTQDCVTIVIDSLEACIPTVPDTSAREIFDNSRRYTFLNLFTDLRDIMRESNSSHRLKIIISCQSPNPSIQSAFNTEEYPHKYQISVSSQPITEIRRVIEYEIEHWDKSALLPSLADDYGDNAEYMRAKAKQAIVNVISAKAQGMFTWAIRVLQWRFRDNEGLRTVEDITDEFRRSPVPSSLQGVYDATYKILYDKDASPSSKQAGRAVKLLFCARKALSSAAFLDAVIASTATTIGHMTEERDYTREVRNLVSSCEGWIRYDSERDTFRFEHPSVEEYLRERALDEQLKEEKWEADSHTVMAEACLRSIHTTVSLNNIFSAESDLDDSDDPDDLDDIDDIDHPEEPGYGKDVISQSNIEKFEKQSGYLDDEDEDEPSADEHGQRSPRRRRASPMRGRRERSSSITSKNSSRSQSSNRPRALSQAASSQRGSKNSFVFGINSYGSVGLCRRLSLWGLSTVSPGFTRAIRTDADMHNPIQDFNEYATLYWPTHYKAARGACSEPSDLDKLLNEMLLKSDPEDETGQFRQWINWVQKIFSQRPIGFYNEDLETELECCIMEKPTPLQVACVYGLTSVVKELINEPSPHNPGGSSTLPLVLNSRRMSGLHMACRFGRLETVEYLATRATYGRDLDIFDQADKSPLQYSIEAADKQINTRLVEVVLKTREALQYQKTNAVLLAAMNNSSCSERLLELILGPQLRWDQLDPEQKEGLIVGVATYPFTTETQVRRIVGAEFLEGHILVAIASSERAQKVEWGERSKIWRFLLKLWARQMRTSLLKGSEYLHRTIEAAIQSGDAQLAEFIILHFVKVDKRSPSFWMGMFKIAVQHRARAGRLVDFLLRCSTDVQVDSEVLVAALENPAVDMALLSKLIQRMGTEDITIPILMAASTNPWHGAEALQALIARGANIPTDILRGGSSDKLALVVEEAIAKGNVRVLKILFGQLRIPAASGILHRLIYDLPEQRSLDATRRRHNTVVDPLGLQSETPEDSWDGLIAECVDQMTDMLPSSDAIDIDTLLKAASIRGPRVMERLLRRAPAPPSISDFSKLLVLEATGNATYGYALLSLLEREECYRKWFDDDDVLRKTARHGDLRAMKFLLGTSPLETYSPEFRIAAASNPKLALTEYVFRRLDPGTISMEELKAGAATSDATFEYLLGRRATSPETKIAASKDLGSIIAEKRQRPKTLRLAFDSGACPRPGTAAELEELLASAVRNEHGLEMASYLLSREQTATARVAISRDLLRAAAVNGTVGPEMLRLLLGHCEDRRVRSIVDVEVLEAAAGRRGSSEALRMLLLELDPADVSAGDRQRVWDAISENPTTSPTYHLFRGWLPSEDDPYVPGATLLA